MDMSNSGRLLGISATIGAIVALGVIIFSFVIFESNAPSLNNANIPTHWNLNDEMVLNFSDESGLRNYHIKVLLDNEIIHEETEIILNKPKNLNISLPKPSTTLKNGTKILYDIELTDWSNAHFFTGNTKRLELSFIVDSVPPQVNLIANSYQINRGGAAMVAFEIKDVALDNVYITNGTDKFRLFKYLGENIYVGIIAWPIKNKAFNGTLIAIDKAGNTTKYNLPLVRNINVPYYTSNIRIKADFLSGKLNELLAHIDSTIEREFESDVDKFVFFNEEIRARDEAAILEASNNIITDRGYIDEEFKAFVPLKGSKLVGSFGDFRTYYLDNEKLSEATHLGIDVASVRNAPIMSSNRGIVLLKSYLGLYGNTALIYHGFGISSIYAHMQEGLVEVSDEVSYGTQIGKTGQTGWAFGDHLHFGILVQGHFVRLAEWLDQKWIDNNIISVLLKTQLFYQQSLQHNAQRAR